MAPESHSTLILSIGSNPELLSTRQMLLQSAGYIVESTCSTDQAIRRVRDSDFDLVMVCHSLSESEKERLTRAVREMSSIPIIFVGLAPSDPEHAHSETGPVELLRNIELLLGQMQPFLQPRENVAGTTK